MREILFKATRVDGKGWVEGSLIISYSGKFRIIYEQPIGNKFIDDELKEFNYEVIPETVCQFTGLLDKNGNRIFEGDIVNSHAQFEDTYIREVIWGNNCGLEFKPLTGYTLCKANEPHFEIIGNIHHIKK